MKRWTTALAILIACRDRSPQGADAAPSSVPSREITTATADHEAPSAPLRASLDAGPNVCKLTGGPYKQPYRGPITLSAEADGVHAFFNLDGTPSPAFILNAMAKSADDSAPQKASGPPCAVAESHVFCMDHAGAIHHANAIVAQARAGTRIAAARIDGHAGLTFLRDRKSSEGMILEGALFTDDGKIQTLSEEGSGSTFVTIATRGNAALALLLDGRNAMTPVHAREIHWRGSAVLGNDAVIFLGGGAEPGTRSALSISKDGSAFALLPVAHDIGFGLAVVRIEAEPKTDSPVVWSDYPNGLDPAPIAATVNSEHALVARVLPIDPKPGARRALELGRIDDHGNFVRFGEVATHGNPHDIVIAASGSDTVLGYTDDTGTWIEKRSCP